LSTIYLAAVIFVLTYVLISLRGLPKLRMNKGAAALIGGALMVLFGIVAFTDVPDSINFDVILLLLGMMILAAGLEFSGFFDIVSDKLVIISGNRVKLLASIMVASAVLSAVILNDAVVLIFTPIVIKCCRRIDCEPVPYLIGVMFSANIGSLATPIGNPQNAYIASESGMTFIDFTVHTLPIALLCLPVAFIIIFLMFRKKLVSPSTTALEIKSRNVDHFGLGVMLTVCIGAFVGFVFSDLLGVKLYVIAMTAGMLALIFMISKNTKNIIWVAKKVDWGILAFFIGLFVLMAGIVNSGLLDQIASLFPGFGDGGSPSILGLTAFSALLSNLVSNVPAVMLIGDMIPQGSMMLWCTLAASSTLAGNATLIGSAANVIVSERSEEMGVKFNFWKFTLVGIPVTLVTLMISVGILTLFG